MITPKHFIQRLKSQNDHAVGVEGLRRRFIAFAKLVTHKSITDLPYPLRFLSGHKFSTLQSSGHLEVTPGTESVLCLTAFQGYMHQKYVIAKTSGSYRGSALRIRETRQREKYDKNKAKKTKIMQNKEKEFRSTGIQTCIINTS